MARYDPRFVVGKRRSRLLLAGEVFKSTRMKRESEQSRAN